MSHFPLFGILILLIMPQRLLALLYLRLPFSLPNSSTDIFSTICSLKIANYPTAQNISLGLYNIIELFHDILSSLLITYPSKLSNLVDCYNLTISQRLDKHPPLKAKIIRTIKLVMVFTKNT